MAVAEGLPSRPGLRLHWSSPLFVLLTQLRQGLPAVIGLLIAGSSDRWEIYAVAAGVVAATLLVLHAVVLVWTTRFWLEPGELVILKGVWFRHVRHLPFARVQNVVLTHNPVHRLFQVSALKLESGGAKEADGQLQVISAAQARAIEAGVERLRQHLSPDASTERAEAAQVASPESAPALLELPTVEVLKAGIVLERGYLIVLAALAGAFTFDIPGFDIYAWLRTLFSFGIWLAGGFNTWSLTLVLLAMLLLVQVLTSVLSMLQALLLWHGFRLDRDGPRLRVESGLISRSRSSALPDRIQVLRIFDGLWLRCLDRRVLGLDLVGSGASDFAQERPLEWLAPIVDARQASRLCREALPELDLGSLDWQPLHHATHSRLAKRSLLFWSVPALAVSVLWPVGLLPVLLAALLGQVHAWAWARYAAWAVTPDFIAWRSGVLARQTWVVPIARLDGCTLIASPFDRRHGSASLRLDTQAPVTRFALKLAFLPYARAEALAQRIRLTTPLEHA